VDFFDNFLQNIIIESCVKNTPDTLFENNRFLKRASMLDKFKNSIDKSFI